ncbi:MAG: hypothetical protein ACLRPV_02095 [Lacrimispora saccharolytica]
MKEKTDRRIRKTKAQLRAGLAKRAQEKVLKKITVKELVEGSGYQPFYFLSPLYGYFQYAFHH